MTSNADTEYGGICKVAILNFVKSEEYSSITPTFVLSTPVYT